MRHFCILFWQLSTLQTILYITWTAYPMHKLGYASSIAINGLLSLNTMIMKTILTSLENVCQPTFLWVSKLCELVQCSAQCRQLYTRQSVVSASMLRHNQRQLRHTTWCHKNARLLTTASQKGAHIS